MHDDEENEKGGISVWKLDESCKADGGLVTDEAVWKKPQFRTITERWYNERKSHPSLHKC